MRKLIYRRFEDVNPEFEMKPIGNWNRNFPQEEKIITKWLTFMKIDNKYDYAIDHDEILKLIEKLNEVDLKNIKMIEDPNINIGKINNPEIKFIEKLDKKIKELKKEENGNTKTTTKF